MTICGEQVEGTDVSADIEEAGILFDQGGNQLRNISLPYPRFRHLYLCAARKFARHVGYATMLSKRPGT